jgi:oligopeptidase A
MMEKFPICPFDAIKPEAFLGQLETVLQDHLASLAKMIEAGIWTWDRCMAMLEAFEDEVERIWAPFAHMHHVVHNPILREVYEQCLPKLSEYESAIAHNAELYQGIKQLDTSGWDSAQDKIFEDTLQHFRLQGADLSPADQKILADIDRQLSELSNSFEKHIMDTEVAFSLHIEDQKELSGLPEYALEMMRQNAITQEKAGYVLNLEFPCYYAVMTYADNRTLRANMYEAYVTRASDVGPYKGQFDNTPVMQSILELRHQKAAILGFPSYAHMSLSMKMAKNPDQVMEFLHDLRQRAYSKGQLEYKALQDFAKQHCDISDLAPYDIGYVSEKNRQHVYAFSEEMLRPYFPLQKVLSGMFSLVEKLYGMKIEILPSIKTWHPEVQVCGLKDKAGHIRGVIYMDIFARPYKRNGAWMDSMQSRYVRGDKVQYPIATLTCNFTKPVPGKPATLSHDEMTTLFHEFGHCLHHVLTQVSYPSVAGIHGVEWDAVELPSQFFENWCWDESILEMLSEHIETKKTLPHALYEKLVNARHFQSAMALLRQLEFALFDMHIHMQKPEAHPEWIMNVLADVRKQVSVTPSLPYQRSPHSFSHIFAGGYAAGYYSYLWAEVLSSDAFSVFEEAGILDKQSGQRFLESILEMGGSRKAMASYVAFRGREPNIDALLRHRGII